MDTPSTPRRAAIAFILITVTLDMLALGIVIPVLPLLVVQLSGGAMAAGSEIFGLFGTAWAAMQFLFAPLFGALSDRYGRRPIILLSNLALGLDYILMALAPSLWLLFAGRVISGIASSSVSTAYAYIADVTEPAKRAAAFGLVGAAFGVGFVLGPAIGGVLGDIDARLPFWLAAGLSLLNALYGLLVLPESLAPQKRSSFAWANANPLGALRLLASHFRLSWLAVIAFISRLAHDSLPSVFVLYAAYRFGWDNRVIGLTLAAFGVSFIVVQGGVIRPAIARLGERKALLLGLGCGAAGFAIYGLASAGWMVWLAIPVMALWGLANPALQGLMSRRVGATEQGRLQGAIASINGIAGVIGPTLFASVFAYFIATTGSWQMAGAPYLLAALLMALSLALAWRSARA